MLKSHDLNQFTDYGYSDDKFTGKGPRDSATKLGLEGHYVPVTDLAAVSFRPIAESEVVVPSDMMAT